MTRGWEAHAQEGLIMLDMQGRLGEMESERLRELVSEALGEPRAVLGKWEAVPHKANLVRSTWQGRCSESKVCHVWE